MAAPVPFSGGMGSRTPLQLSGARVEGAHRAEFRIVAAIVADRRSHDHEIVNYHRRRGHLIIAGILQLDALGQVHGAVLAEIAAYRAIAGRDGNQPGVNRGQEDASQAAALHDGRRRFAVHPSDHSAGSHFRIALGAIHLRIVFPDFLAVLRIERDYLVERRAQIHDAVHYDRRGFEGRFAIQFGFRLQGVGVIHPSLLQLRHIGAVDQRQRRVARAAAVVAVIGPVGIGVARVGLVLGRGHRRAQQHREQNRQTAV